MWSIPLKLELDQALKVECFCRKKPINQNSLGQVFKGLTPCLGQDQAWSELQLVKFIQ